MTSRAALVLFAALAAACHAPSVARPQAPRRSACEEHWFHHPILLGGGLGADELALLDELIANLDARDDVVRLRIESHDCQVVGQNAEERAQQVAQILRARGLRLQTEVVAYVDGRCSLCSCLDGKRSSKCTVSCPATDAEALRAERRVEFSVLVQRCPVALRR